MNGAIPKADFVRGQNKLIGGNHVKKNSWFRDADVGNTAVGMQTGKNLFTKAVDTSAVAKQNGDLPKFSSTKEDAPGYVPPKGKNIKIDPMDYLQAGSGALGLIGGVYGKAVKMLNFANIRSAVKQYVGKGKVPTKPRLVDQYHTVDRGAIKKFNQITKDASGGGSRPLIINKGTNPGSKAGGPSANYTSHLRPTKVY